MASSAVSICSNALLLLGDRAIASFSDSGDRVTLVANLYDDVRRATLRMHPWNCAIKRVSLAPEATAPTFGWSASFVLPGDWLRTLSVGEDGDAIPYEMENGRIVCDESEVLLRYVYDNEDVPSWDALLVEAMTMHMAVALAYPITKSASMQEAMQARLNGVLQQARSVNGQESPPQEFGDYPFLASRYGA